MALYLSRAIAGRKDDMRTTIILCAMFLLGGCSDASKELKFAAMPKELADCKVFRVTNANGEGMTVARCPNSTATTSVQSGKTQAVSIVVDGIEYMPAQK